MALPQLQEQLLMRLKRRLLPNFETCSVALFAALALGGPLQARAQIAALSTPTSQTTPAPNGGAIPPNRWTRENLTLAFKRVDTDSDGQLSRQEASLLAGLPGHFDRIDSNKDGSISSAEFDEALK
jgi:hypothetical protein